MPRRLPYCDRAVRAANAARGFKAAKATKAARIGALRARLDAATDVTYRAMLKKVESRLLHICSFFECDTDWLSGASSRKDALEFLGSCIVDQIDALWRPIEMHLIQNASSPDIPDLISTLSALVPTVSSRWNLSDLTSTLEALVHKRYPEFTLCVAQTD